MCNSRKERLIVPGLVLAAPAFVVFSTPWAHAIVDRALNRCPGAHGTLEASLNCLWVVLALTLFVHSILRGSARRRGPLPGLVSLTFIFSLLFPVISADDDLAQFTLINDANTSQALTDTIKTYKQLPRTFDPVPLPAAFTSGPIHRPAVTPEYLWESVSPVGVADPGRATGNHSPPFLI